MNIHNIKKSELKAWVVFSGQTDLRYLKFLKSGFRHCFVLLNDGQNWISIDPMSHYTEVIVHDLQSEFQLPQWLKKRGYTIISACVNQQASKPAPFGLFNCVEAVKRVLGIHAFGVMTPWQLYSYLNKQLNKKSEKEIIYGKSSFTA